MWSKLEQIDRNRQALIRKRLAQKYDKKRNRLVQKANTSLLVYLNPTMVSRQNNTCADSRRAQKSEGPTGERREGLAGTLFLTIYYLFHFEYL